MSEVLSAETAAAKDVSLCPAPHLSFFLLVHLHCLHLHQTTLSPIKALRHCKAVTSVLFLLSVLCIFPSVCTLPFLALSANGEDFCFCRPVLVHLGHHHHQCNHQSKCLSLVCEGEKESGSQCWPASLADIFFLLSSLSKKQQQLVGEEVQSQFDA